ncbi:STAS domain-containing protein [Streptomyces sp. NPDC059720]|uniref:STAS domain-containing protein n=1 Tax=Streptomyces sp. NPDC059720 TaxID=3346924 RepID=UPI0036A27BC2
MRVRDGTCPCCGTGSSSVSGVAGVTTLVLHEDSTTRLAVVGELDVFTSPHLAAAVQQCLERRPARLVTDLSAVSFCDAAGVSALVAARGICHESGTQLVLQGARPSLRGLLALTDLDTTFGLTPQHGGKPDALNWPCVAEQPCGGGSHPP